MMWSVEKDAFTPKATPTRRRQTALTPHCQGTPSFCRPCGAEASAHWGGTGMQSVLAMYWLILRGLEDLKLQRRFAALRISRRYGLVGGNPPLSNA